MASTQEITLGIQRLANDLQRLQNTNQNTLIFPTPIHVLLTLLYEDPWFINKNLSYNLKIPVSNEQISRYMDIFNLINSTTNRKITNIWFVKQGYETKEDFKNRLINTFSSEIDFLNYEQQQTCLERINSWVDSNTSRKISHIDRLFSNDIYLTSLGSLNITNNWELPFSAEQTVTAPFHLNDQDTIPVEMMRKKDEFYYLNDEYLGTKILKLPFTDDNTSLVVFLPHKSVGIEQLLQRLEYQNYNVLMERMTKQEVDVSLPKFKFNDSCNVMQHLKESILDELRSANLFGLIENEELNLQDVEQKIFIDVNEAGVDSASCTISTLNKANYIKVPPEDGLDVYEVNMSTEISNRFAKTKVVWRVKNDNPKPGEAKFKVILTETAFITEFIMEIQGKQYKSYIKGKEEAKAIYNEAIAHGQSAGLVETKTRDSREFQVSVNLEPDCVAVFLLTYEEMLQRIHDQYELVLNICPGQIVEDLSVEVRINESQSLKFVKTPPMRSGKETATAEQEKYLEPTSDIKMVNSKTAVVKFRPDVSKQQKNGHYLGNRVKEGLAGQFVVQYEVEREPLNGKVLLQDGYFVHFFAPNDLEPLPKHIIFVLDTSGSMVGRKIRQLKDAMTKILNDLRKEDMVSIVEFNSNVVVWDVESKRPTIVEYENIRDFKKPFAYLQQYVKVNPQTVNHSILKKANEIIEGFCASGSTFIIGGLETALYLVKLGEPQNEDTSNKLQPIIVFLTDGQPNVGISSTTEIVDTVTQLNTRDQVPIFSLSLGGGAEKKFLRKLSLKNFGFSRHIYEAADASIQLQDFYKQICSPLLRHIKFKYCQEVEDVTRTWFPIYFRGSEIIVAGRCNVPSPMTVDCWGLSGHITVPSIIEKPVSSLERLWAYLTVKQLLDDRDMSPNPEELTQRTVALALKYSFVTDVTSLVVVKPNDVSTLSDRLPNVDCDQPPLQGHIFTNNCEQSFRSMLRKSKYHSKRSSPSKPMAGSYYEYSASVSMIPTSGVTQCNLEEMCYIDSSESGSSASLVNEPEIRYRRSNISSRRVIMNSSADSPKDKKKKDDAEFIADSPFIIMLQLEKNGTVIVLMQGQIFQPTYQ